MRPYNFMQQMTMEIPLVNKQPIMTKRFLLIVLLCFSYTMGFSQYNKPYRITQDGNNYFVTNKGSGTVVKIDTSFTASTVLTGLFSPNDIFYGSLGTNSVLIIIDSNTLKFYNPNSLSHIANVSIDSAIEAHDGVFDPNNTNVFYIGDRKGNRILKGTIGSAPLFNITYSVLADSISRPTGMIFDHRGRLIVINDTTNAGFHWIDTKTGKDSLLRQTSLGHLNDIVQGPQGNYYVTSWDDEYLYRLDSSFQNETRLVAFNNPAGMFVNTKYDYLTIACNNCNKVEFKSFHLYSPLNDITTCMHDSFYVDFNPTYWGIGTYNGDNEFLIEISDTNGSYSNATVISRHKMNTIPSFLRTVIPTNTFPGDSVRYRIRSTSPATTSYFDKQLKVIAAPRKVYNWDTMTLCIGSKVLLGDGTPIPTSSTFDWDPDSLFTPDNTRQVNFIASDSGVYDISMKETGTTGCFTLNHLTIVVRAVEELMNFADSLGKCKGDSIQINKIQSPHIFHWYGSDELYPLNTPTPIFYGDTSTMLYVTVLDSQLICQYLDSVHVEVFSPILLESGEDSVCLNDIIQPDFSLHKDQTYHWNSSDVGIDTIPGLMLSFIKTGKALVRVNIKDSNGCVAKDSVLYHVNQLPTAIPIDYLMEVCSGERYALGLELDSSLKYSWSASLATIYGSDQYNPEFMVIQPGVSDTIRLEVSDNNTSCSNTESFPLIIYQKPDDLSLKDSLINGIHYVVFSSDSSYHQFKEDTLKHLYWFVNHYQYSTTADSHTFPRENFTHGDSVNAIIFQLSTAGDTLCKYESSYFVKKNLGSISYVHSSPIYPNPSSGLFYLPQEFVAPSFVVYDQQLKEVLKGHSAMIDLRDSTPGIYYVKIWDGDSIYYFRLVKL